MRIIRAAAGLGCLAVLVAGCSGHGGGGGTAVPPAPTSEPSTAAPSSPAPTTTAPAPPAATSAPAPAPAKTVPVTGGTRCHTADLDLALGPEEGAAGHRYSLIELINASGRRCVVQGFGGVALLDGYRRPLPIRITRDGPTPVPSLLAGRGAVAYKPIGWAAFPSGADTDPARCPTPAYIAVIPPDETVPLTVRWPFGVVCGDTISGKAYGVAE